MAWIFPKIEMGLFKWTCLILCFDFIYADVTQQPQEWILNFQNFTDFGRNRQFSRNFHVRK